MDEKCFEAFYGERYLHGQLVRYQLINASIAIPRQLEVLMNVDGYDLKAVEKNSDANSSLMVTITHQQLDEKMTPARQHHQCLVREPIEIKGVNVDGYQGMIIKKDFGLKGGQTSLIVAVNQTVIKVSVVFNDYFVNMEEVTNNILKSFHLNLPQDPGNASLTEFKVTTIHADEENLSNTLHQMKKLFKGRFIAKQLA